MLDYGFRQKPIDQPAKKTISPNIEEEKLYKMNAKVIEFKSPTYSEEDVSDENDEDFAIQRERKKVIENPRCFYYSDIGYSEASNRDRKFINVPLSTTPKPFTATYSPELMGRIIDIPDDENTYAEEMMADYERQCNCNNHKEVFTR